MTDPPTDRNAIEALIQKVTGAASGFAEPERALLAQLLTAGRDAMLGESTIHTVEHGRREDADVGIIGSRIGSARTEGPEVQVTETDGGPAVQINIWLRR